MNRDDEPVSSPTGQEPPKDPWAYDPTRAVPTTPPTQPAPSVNPAAGTPQYGQYSGYQYGQPGQYGYGQYGGYQYGPAYNPYPAGGPYQPVPPDVTNGKAIASLVCGIGGFFCAGPFLSVPAIILGFLARAEIKRTGGRQQGNGLALAGIILGIIVTVLTVLAVIFLIAVVTNGGFDDDYYYPTDPATF